MHKDVQVSPRVVRIEPIFTVFHKRLFRVARIMAEEFSLPILNHISARRSQFTRMYKLRMNKIHIVRGCVSRIIWHRVSFQFIIFYLVTVCSNM